MLKRKCTSSRKQNSKESNKFLEEYVKFTAVVKTWLRNRSAKTANHHDAVPIQLAEFYISELNKYKQLFQSSGIVSEVSDVDGEIERLLNKLDKAIKRAPREINHKQQSRSNKMAAEFLCATEMKFENFIKTIKTQDFVTMANNSQEIDIPLTNENFLTQHNDSEQNVSKTLNSLQITEISDELSGSQFTLDGILTQKQTKNDNLTYSDDTEKENKENASNYDEKFKECVKSTKIIRTWLKNNAGKTRKSINKSIKLANVYVEKLSNYKQLFSPIGCISSKITKEINCLLDDLKDMIETLKEQQKTKGKPFLTDTISKNTCFSINSTNLSDNILADIPLTNSNFVTQETTNKEKDTTMIMTEIDQDNVLSEDNATKLSASKEMELYNEEEEIRGDTYRCLADLDIFEEEPDEEMDELHQRPLFSGETPSPVYQVPFNLIVTQNLDVHNYSAAATIQYTKQPEVMLNEIDDDAISERTIMENYDLLPKISGRKSYTNDDIFDDTESMRYEHEFSNMTDKLMELWTSVQQENDTFNDRDMRTLEDGLNMIEQTISENIVKDLDDCLQKKMENLHTDCKPASVVKKRVNPFKWSSAEKPVVSNSPAPKKNKPDEEKELASSKPVYLPNPRLPEMVMQEACSSRAMLVNWEDLVEDEIYLVDDD